MNLNQTTKANMKYLVIGLGSMGKRRIRCLQALGEKNISGFDLRDDRCKEVTEKYGVNTYYNFDEAVDEVEPGALIISVPPDKHKDYIMYAIREHKHFFVEASVVDDGMADAIKLLKKSSIVAAPSSTLMFHPAIQLIYRIVKSGQLGKISNILLHSGQYLQDWHTYEFVGDYYVSNPATGGGREIVPFELTWFTEVFGFPRRVTANYKKTIDIEGAEYIDDTYNCLLDYGSFMAVITVDVVSRYATRRLTINGSEGQLIWSWDENYIKIFNPSKKEWENISYEMGSAESGYNANIGENMYIEEIRNFVDAINGLRSFINSMDKDLKVLDLLYKFEQADKLSSYIEV